MSHVFISYCHQDGDYARKFAAELQQRGFEVWIDERIDYGDRWFKEISKAIRDCAAFSVIMTPAAEESEWVEREILVAQKHSKPIFPLLLDGREFDLLITTQFANVRGGIVPTDDFFARLARLTPVSHFEESIQKPTPNLRAEIIALLEQLISEIPDEGLHFSPSYRIGPFKLIVSSVAGNESVSLSIPTRELSKEDARALNRLTWSEVSDAPESPFMISWTLTRDPALLEGIADNLLAAVEVVRIAPDDIEISGGSA